MSQFSHIINGPKSRGAEKILGPLREARKNEWYDENSKAVSTRDGAGRNGACLIFLRVRPLQWCRVDYPGGFMRLYIVWYSTCAVMSLQWIALTKIINKKRRKHV